MLFALAAWSAPPPPKLELPPPSWALDLSQICYPSGLLVDVVRRPEAKVVAVTMVIGGGNAAETEETRGAAHLVEHLWFRSRPGGGPRPWDLEAGLALEGATLTDATVYSTVGAAADLERLLTLEVERLRDPLQGIAESDVIAERDVIASELLWRGDHSDRAARRWLDSRLWPADHPYAASTASIEGAGKLGLDAVRAYAAASYRPEHTAIRVEGDVDANVVAGLLDRLVPDAFLEGSSKCTHPPVTTPPPAPVSTELAKFGAPVWKPRLYVGFSLPPAGGPNDQRTRFAVDVLEEVVWRRLGFARGVRGSEDVAGGCEWVPGQQASMAVCVAEFPDERAAADAWPLILGSLEQQWLVDGDPVRNPVIRASASSAYLGAFLALDAWDTDTLVERGMGSWRGAPDPAAAIVDTAFTVQSSQVVDLARKWLHKDRAVGVILVPAMPALGAAEGKALTVSLDAPALPPWKPAATVPNVSAERLANGLDTWVVRRDDAPYLAHTTLASAGGWATGPAGANDLLEALERYDLPMSLTEVADEVPTHVAANYGSLTDSVHTLGPVGSLDVALWEQRGLAAMTLDMESRQSAIDDQLLRSFEVLSRFASPTADQLRSAWLLPDDPAGAMWWERLQAAKYAREVDARGWENTVRRPSNSTLVVTAPMDPVVVRGSASKWLLEWKAKGKPIEPVAAALPPAPGRKTFVLDGRSVLSDVTVTCRVPGRTDANAAAHAVLDPVLERGLFQTLREGGGLYAIEAWTDFRDRRVGLLTLSARTEPGQARATRDAMLGVLEALRAGAPDAAVAWGRLSASGAWARSVASAAGTHAVLTTALDQGLTLQGVKAMPERLSQVDAAALGALLADCAGHEAITVSGPDPGAGLDGERMDWVTLAKATVESLK